jgi:hypothetical protein
MTPKRTVRYSDWLNRLKFSYQAGARRKTLTGQVVKALISLVHVDVGQIRDVCLRP